MDFEAFWEWLGANSAQVGAVSSFMFGVSSAIVAWVALRLNYRNNFGWKPVVFISMLDCRKGSWHGEDRTMVTLGCEVWNWQKYPVVVNPVVLWVLEKDFEGSFMPGGPYYGEGNSMNFLDDVRLEPNAHHTFEAVGYVPLTDKDWEPACRVEVWYYDPRRNKRKVVKDSIRRWPWTKVEKKEDWED